MYMQSRSVTRDAKAISLGLPRVQAEIKQVTEVENFVMTLSDYSPVQLGYFNIIDEWKEENESA